MEETKKTQNKTKFNSFWDPIKVEPTDCSNPMMSQDELGYNEKGQVTIIHNEPKNIQEEINSYERDTLLSEQLKRIANRTQEPRAGEYLDISEMPTDAIGVMANRKKVDQLESKMKAAGFDTKKILEANDEELNEIIKQYVASKLPKNEEEKK